MRTITIAAIAVLFLGCATTMDAPMAGAMSDGEIAAIVSTAHLGEIEHGNAALSKAVATDVRGFARMMVDDHTNALSTARQVFDRRGITPMENSVSETLRSNGQRALTALNTYNGRDFDREYIKSQVATHEWLLNTLDQSLIPAAKNGEVRQLLQAQRGVVAKHLDEAKKIWIDIA